MPEGNIWAEIVDRLKAEIDPEEFRRWFLASSYASDSGDVISVWVPSIIDGRQILQNYNDRIQRALTAMGRGDTVIRFIATGYSDDEDEADEA
jgi:chromosomal replication initiation ATPase DnaA